MTGPIRTSSFSEIHLKIHEEKSFLVWGIDDDMGDTETIIIAFKTPDTGTLIHMTVDWATKVAGFLDIIEGPTWTNQTGTLQTVYNRHRVSSNQTVLLDDQSSVDFEANNSVNLNPTGLAGGTIIDSKHIFVAVRDFVHYRGLTAFILKSDTQYAIRLTADGAGNAGMIRMNWYEDTE